MSILERACPDVCWDPTAVSSWSAYLENLPHWYYPTHVPKLPIFAISRSWAHLPGLSCTLKLLVLLVRVLGATVEHAYANAALAAVSMFVVPCPVRLWYLAVTAQWVLLLVDGAAWRYMRDAPVLAAGTENILCE
jgi:hypothetical protein